MQKNMKKGFTLIELLAVILILGIIALIAIPQVTNVIENASKGATETSAIHYIDAINNDIALTKLDSDSTNDITDGIKNVSDITVSINGETPTSGIIYIKNGIIEKTIFTLNGYSVECNKNGKCVAIKEYVYYNELESTLENVKDGVKNRPTNYNSYLKFPVINGELGSPLPCFYTNNEEFCLYPNEPELSKELIKNYFNYDESTWVEYNDGLKVEPTNSNISCIVRSDSFGCSNENVGAYTNDNGNVGVDDENVQVFCDVYSDLTYECYE